MTLPRSISTHNPWIYDNPWIFNGQVFNSSDISDYFGFVYCIINKTNGKRYIGRKYFYTKRKNEKKKESNWKNYYGSSAILKEDIEKLGSDNFERQILSLHKTKGAVNYSEIEEQILRRVIQDESYYNISIAGKYSNVNLLDSDYNTKLHSDDWCEIHSKFMTIYNNSHRWINNGEKNKKIPNDEALPDGWFEGRFVSDELKKAHSEKIKEKWRSGAYNERDIISTRKPLTEEKRKKLQEANRGEKNPRFGKKNSIKHTESIIASVKGTIWVTDGTENKRINPSELDEYLTRGFRRGQSQTKKDKRPL